MQNLILSRLEPVSNLKNEKQKSSCGNFLFGPFCFLPILIKFTFLIFTDTSGRVGNFFPDPGNGEKLAGTFLKKKIKSIPRQEVKETAKLN